jgi:hypothetical protein
MQQEYAKPVYYWEKNAPPASRAIQNLQQRAPMQQHRQPTPDCAPIRLYHEEESATPVRTATNAYSPTTREQHIAYLLDRLEAVLTGTHNK